MAPLALLAAVLALLAASASKPTGTLEDLLLGIAAFVTILILLWVWGLVRDLIGWIIEQIDDWRWERWKKNQRQNKRSNS